MTEFKRVKVQVIDGLWKGLEGEITNIIDQSEEIIVSVHLFNCRKQHYTLKQLSIDLEPRNIEKARKQGLI